MDYTIKTATLEEMPFLISQAKIEGWNPGLDDALPYYTCDPKGFLIGELQGEKISCISAVNYDDNYAFMGFYITIPKYRHQGYGITIWNKAIEHCASRCIGLDGVVEQQENYKKSGFQLHYRNIRYTMTGGGSVPPALVPLDTLPFNELDLYDTQVFGCARSPFLQKWTAMPHAKGLAAVENSKIKGYGIIRKCAEGWKVGPLFADTPETAATLFDGLKAQAPGQSIYLDVPAINEPAAKLAAHYTMRKVFETARMYTKKPPAQQLAKVFGVTSFELG